MRGDLAEAKRATEYRTFAEALLTYIKVIPPRASRATLPDPLALERRLEIPLDPRLRPQENAARYFKLAAKAERGLKEIPPRLAVAERELGLLTALLERAAEGAPTEH